MPPGRSETPATSKVPGSRPLKVTLALPLSPPATKVKRWRVHFVPMAAEVERPSRCHGVCAIMQLRPIRRALSLRSQQTSV